jgi:hypothetical protein
MDDQATPRRRPRLDIQSAAHIAGHHDGGYLA